MLKKDLNVSVMFKSHAGIVASDTSLNEDCDPMTNNGDQMTSSM